ncbi:MAG: hypothetical protein ACYDGY_02935 [Acidimicrobiales bacterium]
MAMREDCEHFQSRTYSDGEEARFCELDLAPEAPWRCPDGCGSYVQRLVDLTFDRGSLAAKEVEKEPEIDDQELKLLEEAEEILDETAPEIISEVEKERGDASDTSFRSHAVSGTERDARSASGGERPGHTGGSRWRKPWKK